MARFLENIPTATKNLIIINVLISIMTALRQDWMIENFALFYPASPLFKPWQFVTHMFMHGGFWHLFFNMYTLLIFGIVLERVWGPKKFLLFYFLCGLGAAACHCGVEWARASHLLSLMADPANSAAAATSYHALMVTPTVGASGAIYGVLLGYAMLYPDSRLTLIFPPVSFTAKWMVVIFAGIELLTGVLATGDGVAHFAHLGGMLCGFLIILYWKKKHVLYNYYG